MTLVIHNGSILFRGGKIAKSLDCCCDVSWCCDNLPTTLKVDLDDNTGCALCFGTTVTKDIIYGDLALYPSYWGFQDVDWCDLAGLLILVWCELETCKVYVRITCGGSTSADLEMTIVSTSPFQATATATIAGSSCCGSFPAPERVDITVYEP